MNPPESKSPRHVEGICRLCLEERHHWAQKLAEVDAGPWGRLCLEHLEELTGSVGTVECMPVEGEEVPW